MARGDREVAIYQAFEEFPPVDVSAPEKNLLRALLVTAMADVKKKGQVRKKALEYFFSGDQQYPFSFLQVCDYLEIDPKSVLAKVRKLESSSREQETER